FTGSYRVSATAPGNPFAQDVLVSFPTEGATDSYRVPLRTDRIVAGVIFGLPFDWNLELDYTFGRSKYSYDRPPPATNGTESSQFLSGAINLIRDTRAYPFDVTPFFGPRGTLTPMVTNVNDINVRFGGPLGRLPAGVPTMSVLLENYHEAIGDAVSSPP